MLSVRLLCCIDYHPSHVRDRQQSRRDVELLPRPRGTAAVSRPLEWHDRNCSRIDLVARLRIGSEKVSKTHRNGLEKIRKPRDGLGGA